MSIRRLQLIFVIILLNTGLVNAAVVQVSSTYQAGVNGAHQINISDAQIYTRGSTVLAGSNALGKQYAAIFVFKLPDLGVEEIASARLDWNGTLVGGPWMQVSIVRKSQYRFAFLDDAESDPEVILFEDRELLNGLPGTTGDDHVALNDWFTGNYDAGKFVFFRFYEPYDPYVGENHLWTMDASMILSLTTVPEPSTYALIFGSLVLGLVMVRRRFEK
jgi:hypothetical protein